MDLSRGALPSLSGPYSISSCFEANETRWQSLSEMGDELWEWRSDAGCRSWEAVGFAADR